jgi:hypothetical protein
VAIRSGKLPLGPSTGSEQAKTSELPSLGLGWSRLINLLGIGFEVVEGISAKDEHSGRIGNRPDGSMPGRNKRKEERFAVSVHCSAIGGGFLSQVLESEWTLRLVESRGSRKRDYPGSLYHHVR